MQHEDQKTDAPEQNGTGKKPVGVGVPYPFESLQESLSTVEKLVAENGTGVIITKEDVVKVTGRKLNSLVLFFSTYQQYGILAKVHGKGFLPTELFKKYHDKVYPQHEREALLEMFKSVPLYGKIIDNLNHTNLPTEEKFPKLLKDATYGINSNSADKASKVFFENARFLKIIDSNNKLVFNNSNTTAHHQETPKEKKKDPEAKHDEEEHGLFTLPIPLDTKRKAYIQYPLNDLSKKDIRVIVKALAFIASSIIDEESESQFEIKIIEGKESKKE